MPKYVNLIAFLKQPILKEHVVVIKELPDWVQVKNTLYQCLKSLGAQGIMAKSSKIGSDLLYRICPL